MDLAVLCRVSKAFGAICTPLLYSTINIQSDPEKNQAHLRLYRAISKESLSRTTTEFKITIFSEAVCHARKPKGRFTTVRPCNCNKHDQDMGNAIRSLHSLRSLTIICGLCVHYHSHAHILKLDLPMLREFTFNCHGSTDTYPYQHAEGVQTIFRAPFMSRVTALVLDNQETRNPSIGPNTSIYMELMRDTNTLSQLTTLCHYGGRLFDLILSQRPVERIYRPASDFHSYGLNAARHKRPGKLSHLFTYDILNWLPLELKQGIEPYRNLRFVGVIRGYMAQEDNAFVELGVLAQLNRLEFMAINRRRNSVHLVYPELVVDFNPSAHFMDLLRCRHRLLRRVLLLGCSPPTPLIPGSESILWERKSERWESRSAPPLEFWDMIKSESAGSVFYTLPPSVSPSPSYNLGDLIRRAKFKMDSFRRHFLKAPRVLDEDGNAANTTSELSLCLPIELMILIVSYIRTRGDFVSLCKVSKRLRSVCTPFLYRFIDLYPSGQVSNVALHLSLYGNLQKVHLSELVTEFRVTLIDDYICATGIKSTGMWPISLRGCSCESYNQELGKALILMKNLRTLAIHCRLCFLNHSHDYLYHLETRILTEFQFQCLRSIIQTEGIPPTPSILLAPSMLSVASLALECECGTFYVENGGCNQICRTGEVLPNLRILSYSSGRFCPELLATRPVERLCVIGEALSVLRGPISRSPGRLSHLFMINLVGFLRSALIMDPTPYHDLRFIGTINIAGDDERTAIYTLEIFKPLQNLEGVELNHMTLEYHGKPRGTAAVSTSPFGLAQRLFAILEQQHPILRRVLFSTRGNGHDAPEGFLDTVLWEKTDWWQPRTVPYLEYWDILQGKLDDISSRGCDSQLVNGTPRSIYGTPRSFYGSLHSVY